MQTHLKKKVQSKNTLFLLTVFLSLAFFSQVYALTWHFPTDINLPEGRIYHFGDVWIIPSGTNMKITAYFENNWLNYTCTAGTQVIHNGTKPEYVYFDDVEQQQGTTWLYAAGTITVNTTATDVAILWAAEAPPAVEDGVTRFLFETGGSLGFQIDIDITVTLNITSGTLNSTTHSFSLATDGYFRFTAINDTQITIDYEGLSMVYVSGDQANVYRSIDSGDSITVDASNNVFISWVKYFEPWLPLTFIIGMIGLACMFGGPLYGIALIKKDKYYAGMRIIVLFFIIGFALVLAWLW